MRMIDHSLSPRPWAEQHFGGLPFSHSGRGERLLTIAEAMVAQPGLSLPRLFPRWYDTKAAYTFFGQPEATPDFLQSEHRSRTFEAMSSPGVFLLLEDTTELDFSDRAPIQGLGPIGNSNQKTQGFLLHSVLGARWPSSSLPPPGQRRPAVTLLGLCDQQYHLRVPAPPGETRKARLQRERESQLWEWASARLEPTPAQSRWLRVGDAGADIYEHLMACREKGHGFVIRSAQDRALVNPDGTSAGMLYATCCAQPSLGEFVLELPARAGQKARDVTLQMSAVKVLLRAPQRPGAGVGKLPPVSCTAVRIWEETAPEGVEALEWVLLCDAEIETQEQAREAGLQYATRWLCEDFHKALKTGMGAERLQLENAHNLFAAIAVMSVVAVRLVSLREQVRCEPEAPAESSGLDEETLRTLRTLSNKKLETVRDVALAIGRLGGHLNRKSDGMPGWQTLWRGLQKLELIVEGVRLARKPPGFG
jgi:hypothetical protein